MKMIASRELSAKPGAVLAGLSNSGAVVVTRDGVPLGILTPTSPDTLLEDLQEIAFSKARRAVHAIREDSAANESAIIGMDEIDREVQQSRRGRKR